MSANVVVEHQTVYNHFHDTKLNAKLLMSTRTQNVAQKQKKITTGKTIEKPKKEETKTKEELLKHQEKKPARKPIKTTVSSKSTTNLPSKLKISSTTKKTIEPKRPITPPSTRTTKSQFYPNKTMYANALKQRERNKTRTLSPSEVKVLKTEEKPSTSTVQRPRTATLKKPAPVEEYEDDFDSYESDFEDYLSSKSLSDSDDTINSTDEDIDTKTNLDDSKNNLETEEERQLDSGNFELPESKHKQVLSNIIESIENENALVGFNVENKSNLTSLSDEGFEEIKDKLSIVNFADARRKHDKIKLENERKKRGRELLTMIRLDHQNFTILDLQPIPYDVFIRRYGNCNTIQTSVQTGSDNIDEEVQTEEIVTRNTWTQFPVRFSSLTGENLDLYRKERLGTGTDNTEDFTLKYDENLLEIFLKNAEETIVTLLEERHQQKSCKDIENNENNIPFSDGFVTFNTNLQFLQNKAVNFATFSTNTTKIVTVHNSTEGRSFVCVWKISDQNNPEYLLVVYGVLTCCSLHSNLVFAGLNNGLISVWDLNNSEYTIENQYKTPVFISDIETGHNSNIISIETIENNDIEVTSYNLQVYTLDEDGILIIWTLVKLRKQQKTEIKLHVNLKFSFREHYRHLADLQCTDMTVNKLDSNHIFVTTNHGCVLHFVTTGKKAHPKLYAAGSNSSSRCVAPSPFSPLYFMTGHQNGSILLFSRNVQKPLMVMSSNDSIEYGVDFMEWSKNRPCVFYAKDSNNCIHVWDLTKSDIYPIYSVRFKDDIKFIKLSPGISEDNSIKRSYMVIITGNGEINLHILNKEHGQQNLGDYQENIRKFSNYVDRL